MIHNRVNALLSTLARGNRRKSLGVVSLCSANRYVLKAAMLRTLAEGNAVLIEATSNQVNQYGGYTGMNPDRFTGFVRGIADEAGFPFDRVILGGDHLGPNPWQQEISRSAMAKACEMVRAYVASGFTKIHLDASMPCGDDNRPLSNGVIAGRTAELCREAETVYHEHRDALSPPYYVIGTEVPQPGGAREEIAGLHVTRASDVDTIIAMTREAFLARSLHDAWERVIAVVVQPGAEFDVHSVVDYDREKARGLSRAIEPYKALVYEAHSTDYQTRKALKEMVEDHFAILKVGPWLTFAFREAVFALAAMERELLSRQKGFEMSRVREVLDAVMSENPNYWKQYYHGSDDELSFSRTYSFSDRVRYYWPDAKVQDALVQLMKNLSSVTIPLTLLSQYMPSQYLAVREGHLENSPSELIFSRIGEVIGIYLDVCRGS
jgi:D-tagatose-1,6-bisphosphate aldolase subunit GatZ/KbaZ